MAHAPAAICPGCGHVYQARQEIKEVEGELQKIDPSIMRQQMRQEQGQAHSVDDLVNLGYAKGRAKHIIEARQEKIALRTELYNLEQGATQAGIDFLRVSIQSLKPKALKERITYMKAVVGG